MIAVDTCSFVHWLEGDEGEDVDAVEDGMAAHLVVLPPVVLTELLSGPQVTREVASLFRSLPRLELTDGYWERAGALRQKILRNKRRARLGDVLVAQSCIDHGVPLVTRDRDFRRFSPVEGLRFLV